MDLGSLMAFESVYRIGSINRAAHQLFMTPQGLSKSIVRLEKDLGFKLFIRNRQGVQPTPYATFLYPHISGLIDEIHRIREESAEAADAYGLNVGLSNGMYSYLGPDFFAQYEADNPDVRLRLTECSDRAMQDFLLNREMEIGFLIGPVDESKFVTEHFQSVPHVLLVGDESYLGMKPRVTWKDLEGQAIYLLGSDYPVEKRIREELGKRGVRPSAIVGIAGADTALPFVIRGEGVLVSAEYWARFSLQPGIQMKHFEDDTFLWDVFIAYSKDVALSSHAQDFIDQLRGWNPKSQSDSEKSLVEGLATSS